MRKRSTAVRVPRFYVSAVNRRQLAAFLEAFEGLQYVIEDLRALVTALGVEVALLRTKVSRSKKAQGTENETCSSSKESGAPKASS